MRRVKYAVDRLEEMIETEDRSSETIQKQHEFVMQLLQESRTVVNECPTKMYCMDPASPNVSSNVWIQDLEARMKAIADQLEE